VFVFVVEMSDEEGSEEEPTLVKDPKYPVVVEYCGVCGLPCEYCEFGSSWPKCRAWLEQNLPERFAKLSIEARAAGGDKLDDNQVEKGQGKGGKARPEPEVTIELVERSKRKRITFVGGLEQFGIKLSDAAKILRHKFATGCNPAKDKPDLIVIQGDVKFEVVEVLKNEYKNKIKPNQFKFIESGAKTSAEDDEGDDDDEDDDDE